MGIVAWKDKPVTELIQQKEGLLALSSVFLTASFLRVLQSKIFCHVVTISFLLMYLWKPLCIVLVRCLMLKQLKYKRVIRNSLLYDKYFDLLPGVYVILRISLGNILSFSIFFVNL